MGVLGKIASRPAVREVAGIVVDIAAERIRKGHAADGIAPSAGERAAMKDQAAAQIAADPVLQNAMNVEPFWQSRVIVGLATAFAGFALARFDVAGDTRNFVLENMPLLLEALGMLVAAVGRTVKGLKPIDWKRPWTIFGIGR